MRPAPRRYRNRRRNDPNNYNNAQMGVCVSATVVNTGVSPDFDVVFSGAVNVKLADLNFWTIDADPPIAVVQTGPNTARITLSTPALTGMTVAAGPLPQTSWGPNIVPTETILSMQ